jgi:uncharacterized protein YggE
METHRLSSFAFALCLVAAVVCAQAAGERGAAQQAPQVVRAQAPDPATAERLITVEAVAAVRVVPTQLRLVFAVSATGETATQASAGVRDLLVAIEKHLEKVGVGAKDRDVDFIAAMPTYDWRVEKQDEKAVLVERRTGTRVQYNLHVTVLDEAAARVAIEAAIAGDGVDLLAVDYWSSELAAKQVEAQKQALAAARQKADLLLAVFPEKPSPVNVHEQTHVFFPAQLTRCCPPPRTAPRASSSRR